VRFRWLFTVTAHALYAMSHGQPDRDVVVVTLADDLGAGVELPIPPMPRAQALERYPIGSQHELLLVPAELGDQASAAVEDVKAAANA
jgi:hypothetical protein